MASSPIVFRGKSGSGSNHYRTAYAVGTASNVIRKVSPVLLAEETVYQVREVYWGRGQVAADGCLDEGTCSRVFWVTGRGVPFFLLLSTGPKQL